jgi:hypothetical protein
MNRRIRARFKTDLTALVTCSDFPDDPIKGRLGDLSVHGLRLILRRELPVGSFVKVEWGSTTFVGELVYCQAQGQEFLAGLKIEDTVYATTRNQGPNQ